MKRNKLFAWLLLLAIVFTAVSSNNLVAYAAGDAASAATALSPAEVLYTITEEDLTGLNWQEASKVKVYVKITEGGSYSALNAMVKLGPDGADGTPVGKASSKYLVGSAPLISKTGNMIQENLVGNAGTGIYVFPDVNLNHTMQDGSAWVEDYINEITITVSAHTSATNCELLGLIFNNGTVYPKGFTEPVTEAITLDEPLEDTSNKNRTKLQYAVDFVPRLNASAYEADSWAAFTAVVEEAKTLLGSTTATEDAFATMHAKLEATKAGMRFVMDESDSDPLPFHTLAGEELVYEMGLGTNLGNTMDGHSGFAPSETAWQSAITTKEYITALHDAGYNTVRIPVTWGTMINGTIDTGLTINERWLNRVQQIVDYCVSQDMYAIINIHHDGAEQSGWLRVSSDKIDNVYYQFEQVWRIIAEHFKDYDEHLIFESMNEITCMEGDLKNSSAAIAYDTPIIMNLNQIFVNVVRSTGSNNTTRWLAAVAHYANNGSHEVFSLPTDSYNENGGLMFAAHIYKHSTNVSWTYDQIYEVVDGLKRMANKFDVPMYLGEWGNRTYEQAGSTTGYNDIERAYFSEIVTKACQVAGVVPVVWDQGFGAKGEHETGLFSYWNRKELRPIFPSIVEAMVRGTYLNASESNQSYDFKDIVKNPEIVAISSITVEDNVTMKVGDTLTLSPVVSPADTNDVLLWSTEDDTIATVSRGMIHAKSVGTTSVHVYSQSGSVEKTLLITVEPAASDIPAEIITDTDTYQVMTNRTGQISAIVTSKTDTLTYRSSNPAIVTVNAFGKLNGIAEGTAEVIISSSSGATKTVSVNVTSTLHTNSINLALHVLYNDAEKSYWSCELSEPVAVKGNGTYTLSFDLATQLSDAAKNAGITEINKLTAIYIKDYDVTCGNATKSPLTSADIVYDSVKVNGTELTMLAHEPAACVKSGVFDSGKPINAWDGSVVAEVSSVDHTATFTSITQPTSIEVTFTLSNVAFAGAAAPEPTKTPAPTEAPQPTTAPEPTKAPTPTATPEPTKASEPTTAPEATKAPVTEPNSTTDDQSTGAPTTEDDSNTGVWIAVIVVIVLIGAAAGFVFAKKRKTK
ncbi:MAG: cellulase family glycosylhydrolase [Lachnospiraceae bacterium]|nr:cellulase family glycosylhydrolase [Lachnospiraceae bacterium]